MTQQHYVSGPAQLVAAIPHILGFHPTNSLVFAVLNDDYVETLQRIDWPTTDSNSQLSLDYCTGSDLVSIMYADDFEGTSGEHEHQLHALSKKTRERFNLLDQLLVVGDRWRSLMCDDHSCCPTDGRALSSDGQLIDVEYIVRGSSPFATREAMEDALQPIEISTTDKKARDSSLIEVLDRVKNNTHETTRQSTQAINDFRLSIVEELISRLRDSSTLDWPDSGLLIAGLHDIHIRDCLLKRLLDDFELRSQVKAHLLAVIPRSSESSVVVLATALAGCVWLDGNGALASVALHRALECDPSYSLAVLLNRAISFGVPPTVWSDSLLAVSQDECLQGAA